MAMSELCMWLVEKVARIFWTNHKAELSKQMQLWIPFDTQLTNFLDLLNQSHENPILTPRFLALDAEKSWGPIYSFSRLLLKKKTVLNFQRSVLANARGK